MQYVSTKQETNKTKLAQDQLIKKHSHSHYHNN
jgi:hypothetical protein